jgi:hypothetical protein
MQDSMFHVEHFVLENVPSVVHIYDFPSPSEAFAPKLRSILMHVRPVLNARWNPVRKGSLVLCCAGQSLYMWSDEWVGDGGSEEEMAECIGVPASMYIFVLPSLSFSLTIL